MHGPLILGIIRFSLPLMFTGILQLLYNSADMIVVGKFSSPGSIGAIGSTTPIINLVVNTFIALSVGSCVVVARYYGAGDIRGVKRAVHTSVSLAVISGIIVAAVGFFLTRPILEVTGSPADIIDRSELYMKIFFLGSPFNMLYNFGAAILRAVGDTKRPLYFLTISGLLNVALNLVFVLAFGMGVDGVAYATVVSQISSSIMVVVCLMKQDTCIKLELKKLRVHKRETLMIAKIGIPAGIQSALFSLSNVLIQSSVNSFGAQVVEGNAAAASIDSFVYTSMNAVSQATITFTSQNYGARNYRRMNKIIAASCLVVIGISVAMGSIIIGFSDFFLSFFLNSPIPQLTLDTAKLRLMWFCIPYFGCGIMECFAGSMRGLNYSILPMIVSLMGACVFRIVWIMTAFKIWHSMNCLYMSYSVSWALTILAHWVCYIIAMRKLRKIDPKGFEKQSAKTAKQA